MDVKKPIQELAYPLDSDLDIFLRNLWNYEWPSDLNFICWTSLAC